MTVESKCYRECMVMSYQQKKLKLSDPTPAIKGKTEVSPEDQHEDTHSANVP